MENDKTTPKIIFFSLIIALMTMSVSGQTKQISENTIYQLFPTQNFYAFIKLDTRNGKMWQVHFSLNDEEGGEVILNSVPLVNSEEKQVNGRFTLYPTENMYNFILLDQIGGKPYQVQWSLEEKNRVVIPINSF